MSYRSTFAWLLHKTFQKKGSGGFIMQCCSHICVVFVNLVKNEFPGQSVTGINGAEICSHLNYSKCLE